MAKRSTRKNGGNVNYLNGEESTNSMMGGKSKKGRKGGKKTRKLSPALKAWNEKVMKIYREMKAKNPKVRLMDAMKEAKKRS
jgi:hypothetical protein